jgi:hypothetical protein
MTLPWLVGTPSTPAPAGGRYAGGSFQADLNNNLGLQFQQEAIHGHAHIIWHAGTVCTTTIQADT